MWDNTKEFECCWNTGYVKHEEKSKLEYHKLDFFSEDRGYDFDAFKEVNNLDVGDIVELGDPFSTHWVRRMK
jgi:hypothetical protein